ncbi:MAG: 50S ribosomal protein L13 [Ignavibacteriaceae bacterium]|nr:50S ribosomal protein L13 [Ignavibacteriaceae bacterium]
MKKEKATKFYKSEEVAKKWYVIDAKDKTLGRMATKIARIIRGKDKPVFTPNMDTGDFVIVLNADQVRVTGKRSSLKEYYHYSGYPGGLKIKSFRELMDKKPEYVVEQAVRGMLPKTRLGNKLIKKLKVYRGTEHPHVAQKPEILN